jgi:hypothetical protein
MVTCPKCGTEYHTAACPLCGPMDQTNPFRGGRCESASGSRIFGAILILIGLSIEGYFFLFFDPSIPADIKILNLTRVSNLQLLNLQQNGVVVGMGLSLLGGLFSTRR